MTPAPIHPVFVPSSLLRNAPHRPDIAGVAAERVGVSYIKRVCVRTRIWRRPSPARDAGKKLFSRRHVEERRVLHVRRVEFIFETIPRSRQLENQGRNRGGSRRGRDASGWNFDGARRPSGNGGKREKRYLSDMIITTVIT